MKSPHRWEEGVPGRVLRKRGVKNTQFAIIRALELKMSHAQIFHLKFSECVLRGKQLFNSYSTNIQKRNRETNIY